MASFDFTVRVFDDGEAFTVGRVVFDVPGHELVLGHREDADIFGLAVGTDAIESLSWSELSLDWRSVFHDWEAVRRRDR
jgi:hypothetical protein